MSICEPLCRRSVQTYRGRKYLTVSVLEVEKFECSESQSVTA